MAEASISVDQDQFICAVCLDLLKDPVTIPCGHSLCKMCINDCWDQEDQKEIHLKPHLEVPALRKHTLTEASVKLEEKICSKHDEICSLCMLDEHKGNDAVTAAAGRCEKQELEEFCEEEFNKIPLQDQFFLSEPQSRDEFLKYFCYLTLDPNTAHHKLILSEKNRAVSYSVSEQQYSDHPERFDSCTQVLCKESVCGRCYWEVEWRGDRVVFISVSYKDIRRKGRSDESDFGFNNQSWSLRCFSFSSSLSFYHNNIRTDLGVPSPSRIGMYVDHSAGTLSFYSVSDNMKLLHRVQTTFTQPLYAGFGLYWLFGSTSVRLCDPE